MDMKGTNFGGYMNGSGGGLHPVEGFGCSGGQSSSSSTIFLVRIQDHCLFRILEPHA
jgi:hypothetical protein